jgi:hypothetical protein
LKQKKQKFKPDYFSLKIYGLIFSSQPEPFAAARSLADRSPLPALKFLLDFDREK